MRAFPGASALALGIRRVQQANMTKHPLKRIKTLALAYSALTNAYDAVRDRDDTYATAVTRTFFAFSDGLPGLVEQCVNAFTESQKADLSARKTGRGQHRVAERAEHALWDLERDPETPLEIQTVISQGTRYWCDQKLLLDKYV
jgi:hypothetical protein